MPDEIPITPTDQQATYEPTWKRPEVVDPPARLPLRAIRRKGDQIIAEAKSGKRMDPMMVYMRYVHLYMELMQGLQRAKRAKPLRKPRTNEKTGVLEQVYVPDEKLVIEYVNATRALLTDMVKLRTILQDESGGIPAHAIETITKALEPYPEARDQLLIALENAR